MITQLSWWLFWSSLTVIVYTYIGFPLLLTLLALLISKPIKRGDKTPTVSFIIAAYNEAEVITKKLDNLLALDYPRERLQIIVASDGSDDGTNDLVRQYASAGVELLTLPRQGKNRTLNSAVSSARGEILVFSDADSILAPDALRYLTVPFNDPSIGGVAGDYHHMMKIARAAGERTYWDFDRNLKMLQTCIGSVSSVSGALYAVRRSLRSPVPSGVTDDFFTAASIVSTHHRVILEPRAKAFGPVADSTKAEFRRKVRIITRGLRGVWLSRHLLNPFKYGFFSLQLLTHKLLRRLMVLPLLVLLVTAPVLWYQSWFYQLATVAQFGLYGMALLGFLLQKTRLGRLKIFTLPLFFAMVNVAALLAISNFLRGERRDTWVAQRSASA